MLDQDAIARLRALLAKATPGPWAVDPSALPDVRGADGLDVAVTLCKDMLPMSFIAADIGPATRRDCHANAALIAAAVNALPALLALADAVNSAPVVQIGGADGMSCFLQKWGKKSLPSMQGQTVRLLAIDRLGGE